MPSAGEDAESARDAKVALVGEWSQLNQLVLCSSLGVPGGLCVLAVKLFSEIQ